MIEAFTNITPTGVAAVFVVCGFAYLTVLNSMRSLTIIIRGYPPGPYNDCSEFESSGPLSDPDDDEDDDDDDEDGPFGGIGRSKFSEVVSNPMPDRNNMPMPANVKTSVPCGHWTDDEDALVKTAVFQSQT